MKPCTGAVTNNTDLVKESRAFCEGLKLRMDTNGATIGQNPHEAGSDAGDAWDRGWTVGQNAAGGTVNPDNARCCAVDTSITVVA